MRTEAPSSAPVDQQDGLQARPVGSGEPVEVHHEALFRQELEGPARHRGDHGDTTAGQAGDEQVAGAHPDERWSRCLVFLGEIGCEQRSEPGRLIRQERDERRLRALSAHDLDPELHDSERSMGQLLHDVDALDARELDRPFPLLQEASAQMERSIVEPVPEAAPPDRRPDHGETAGEGREAERARPPDHQEEHDRERETPDHTRCPHGDRGRVEPAPRHRDRGREGRAEPVGPWGDGVRHSRCRLPSTAPRGGTPPRRGRGPGSGPLCRRPCTRRAA